MRPRRGATIIEKPPTLFHLFATPLLVSPSRIRTQTRGFLSNRSYPAGYLQGSHFILNNAINAKTKLKSG
jgi:hypothetical protein